MPAPRRQATLTRYLTRASAASPAWTRLVQANAQLQLDFAEAVEAHRRKSAFLAGLSHQLRTPLNTILLCSELLSDDLTDHGLTALAPDLERIQSAGKHLLVLLDDVLDLTRIEAGRMVFQRQPTDLGALVERMAAAFRPAAERHGSQLQVLADPGLPEAHSDPVRIEQILFHLLNNAVKFTQDGLITLEARGAGEGQVRLTVRDTGVGMPAEQVARIRLDFAQSAETQALTFGNAGLGLTLCRRLAEGLGGSMQVDSQERLGSAFTLRLPLQG